MTKTQDMYLTVIFVAIFVGFFRDGFNGIINSLMLAIPIVVFIHFIKIPFLDKDEEEDKKS